LAEVAAVLLVLRLLLEWQEVILFLALLHQQVVDMAAEGELTP
jgi:hypothetical protein